MKRLAVKVKFRGNFPAEVSKVARSIGVEIFAARSHKQTWQEEVDFGFKNEEQRNQFLSQIENVSGISTVSWLFDERTREERLLSIKNCLFVGGAAQEDMNLVVALIERNDGLYKI